MLSVLHVSSILAQIVSKRTSQVPPFMQCSLLLKFFMIALLWQVQRKVGDKVYKAEKASRQFRNTYRLRLDIFGERKGWLQRWSSPWSQLWLYQKGESCMNDWPDLCEYIYISLHYMKFWHQMCCPRNMIYSPPTEGFGLHSPSPLEIPNLHYQPINNYLSHLEHLMSMTIILGIFFVMLRVIWPLYCFVTFSDGHWFGTKHYWVWWNNQCSNQA